MTRLPGVGDIVGFEAWGIAAGARTVHLPLTAGCNPDLRGWRGARTEHAGPHEVVALERRVPEVAGAEPPPVWDARLRCLAGCPSAAIGSTEPSADPMCLDEDAFGPGILERAALDEAREELAARRAA